jgi:hypothetical protein
VLAQVVLRATRGAVDDVDASPLFTAYETVENGTCLSATRIGYQTYLVM